MNLETKPDGSKPSDDDLIKCWKNFIVALDDGVIEFSDSGLRNMAMRTIEALSAPTSIEVRDALSHWDPGSYWHQLIERLARDASQATASNETLKSLAKDLAAAQQRIDELNRELKYERSTLSTTKLMDEIRKNKELQQRVSTLERELDPQMTIEGEKE